MDKVVLALKNKLFMMLKSRTGTLKIVHHTFLQRQLMNCIEIIINALLLVIFVIQVIRSHGHFLIKQIV